MEHAFDPTPWYNALQSFESGLRPLYARAVLELPNELLTSMLATAYAEAHRATIEWAARFPAVESTAS